MPQSGTKVHQTKQEKDGHDLREVKPAIQEGTKSELSRLGKAGSSRETAGQHSLHTHASTMALQLDHILTGV